nr:MAG TPA: hypothetical protein [Caudoviricetes sp.]
MSIIYTSVYYLYKCLLINIVSIIDKYLGI